MSRDLTELKRIDALNNEERLLTSDELAELLIDNSTSEMGKSLS